MINVGVLVFIHVGFCYSPEIIIFQAEVEQLKKNAEKVTNANLELAELKQKKEHVEDKNILLEIVPNIEVFGSHL